MRREKESQPAFPLFRDPRDFQIAFLAAFLILGTMTRDWTLRVSWVAIGIGSSLLAQWCFDRFWMHRTPELRSAWITAISLGLLLRGNHNWSMALAGSFAIASKFVFRYKGKHFFNPSNFGIIAALLFARDAWVSPGQWGEDWGYALLFAGAGGIVLKRVGRWDTTAAFLGSYALLEASRNAFLGWTWDVYLHRLMSGSLILFSLFMITDPRVIPDARSARVFWSTCVALLAFYLRNHFYSTTAVFWALFILSPVSILFDMIWKAPRFSWRGSSEPERSVSPSTLEPEIAFF